VKRDLLIEYQILLIQHVFFFIQSVCTRVGHYTSASLQNAAKASKVFDEPTGGTMAPTLASMNRFMSFVCVYVCVYVCVSVYVYVYVCVC